MKNIPFIILLLSMLYACGSDTNESNNTGSSSKQNSVMVNRIFSDVHFGMSKSAVGRKALGEKVEDDTNLMTFSKGISATDFEDLSYTFNENKLEKIEYMAYLESASDARQLHTALQKEFDNNFTKVGKLWDGQINKMPFTVFLKKTKLKDKNVVIAIFEEL